MCSWYQPRVLFKVTSSSMLLNNSWSLSHLWLMEKHKKTKKLLLQVWYSQKRKTVQNTIMQPPVTPWTPKVCAFFLSTGNSPQVITPLSQKKTLPLITCFLNNTDTGCPVTDTQATSGCTETQFGSKFWEYTAPYLCSTSSDSMTHGWHLLIE